MGEAAGYRAMIAHRAALMHAWKTEETYALHQLMLQELWDSAMNRMVSGSVDEFSELKGYLRAIKDVQTLAERSIIEHKKQNVEVA